MEIYQCKYCRMKYSEKEWQQKCEAWCAKHKSCNIEVIRHAAKG